MSTPPRLRVFGKVSGDLFTSGSRTLVTIVPRSEAGQFSGASRRRGGEAGDSLLRASGQFLLREINWQFTSQVQRHRLLEGTLIKKRSVLGGLHHEYRLEEAAA